MLTIRSWVFSSETTQKQGQEIYSPGASSTSRQLQGESWSISYGDGSGASGNVFADKVAVGGATVTSQAIEAATSVSSSFARDSASSGLLGVRKLFIMVSIFVQVYFSRFNTAEKNRLLFNNT